jgi:hypothetical protein
MVSSLFIPWLYDTLKTLASFTTDSHSCLIQLSSLGFFIYIYILLPQIWLLASSPIKNRLAEIWNHLYTVHNSFLETEPIILTISLFLPCFLTNSWSLKKFFTSNLKVGHFAKFGQSLKCTHILLKFYKSMLTFWCISRNSEAAQNFHSPPTSVKWCEPVYTEVSEPVLSDFSCLVDLKNLSPLRQTCFLYISLSIHIITWCSEQILQIQMLLFGFLYWNPFDWRHLLTKMGTGLF